MHAICWTKEGTTWMPFKSGSPRSKRRRHQQSRKQLRNIKEGSSTASQDEVNSQAVNWTGAATLEGTRNKQIITACTALRNKGWDIVARDKEPKLSTGWERVKVGLRGTPGIVNRAKKSLKLGPHVTDKITWLNKFQSLLTWRIRNAEKRLTAFRKSL